MPIVGPKGVDGRWIVIEVNDTQESGYAGIVPLSLWQRMVEIEREFQSRRDR